MNYINAKKILPPALLKELQNYLQGEYLYMPTTASHQKRWVNAPAIVGNYSKETAAFE